tara:strand:+ start:1449 stop:2138 length:690 start_codon:yes stop_codon:yes gene_type:complete
MNQFSPDSPAIGRISKQKSWIVQRLNKPRGYINPYTDTIRDMENKSAQEIVKEVFTPDYMGAAEYEFGRLPESMARMFDNADKLSLNLFELSIIKSEFPDLKLDPDKSVQDLLNDLPGEKKKNIFIVCYENNLGTIKDHILKHYHQGYINWQWMNYLGTKKMAKANGIEYEESAKRDYGSFYLRVHKHWRDNDLQGWYDVENDFAWFINKKMAHLFFKLFDGERFKGWD